jgi:hypothetical protein
MRPVAIAARIRLLTAAGAEQSLEELECPLVVAAAERRSRGELAGSIVEPDRGTQPAEHRDPKPRC